MNTIANEYVYQSILESAKSAAICAAAVTAVSNPIGLTGAALFGGVVHAAERFSNWMGREIFFLEDVSMEKVSGPRKPVLSFVEPIDSNGNLCLISDPKYNLYGTGPNYTLTEKVLHVAKLSAQIALAIVVTAFVAFRALQYAPALGITEKTVVALSTSLTFPTALALTATSMVGLYILNYIYDVFMK